MLRTIRMRLFKRNLVTILVPTKTFLTNEYKCSDAWNTQISSPILSKVNLNDFYNILDQNFSSKGVISAIDVDIFANAVKDSTYLDELKDLLHKLRLSAETGNTLQSTHHATIRNYIQFGNLQDLVQILKDPLNFGVFLDFYTANILLDKLVTSQNYELAANVASLMMLQEDYSNNITNALCKFACYKFLKNYEPPSSNDLQEKDDSNKKKDEIKIRVKFLRNPYFDDHFDITDIQILAGKTLAWIAENSSDYVNDNLQLIGWLYYKKYDKLLSLSEHLVTSSSFKIYTDVLDLISRECGNIEGDTQHTLEKCREILGTVAVAETNLEDSIKIEIENAINKTQTKDISDQKQLFKSWEQIREDKLEEQSKRLDRTKRMKLIEERQKQLEVEEQKLWFFENEEDIDLQIEDKEKLIDTSVAKKTAQQKNDENYIPPEILPKKK